MSQLSGRDPSGLRDLRRVLGSLVRALLWEQTLLVEDVQQDKSRHDQERGEAGRERGVGVHIGLDELVLGQAGEKAQRLADTGLGRGRAAVPLVVRDAAEEH